MNAAHFVSALVKKSHFFRYAQRLRSDGISGDWCWISSNYGSLRITYVFPMTEALTRRFTILIRPALTV
jgi:hypothetical protein